jgi:hypothetical protein
MQMTHPNEALLRKGYEAYERGDGETVESVMADDIEWHLPGTGPLAGDYIGKDQVLGFFAKKMELSGGTFTEESHDVFANDRHVVGLTTFTGQRRGKSLSVNAIQLWQMREGKLADCVELFEDQEAWDEFWS